METTTKRFTVQAAEGILGERVKVLDHGHVALVEYLGGDETVERAARLSYGSDEPRSEKERRSLIRYLVRHRHTSPLEQVVLTFDCKMPIFVARQWVRHRTARLNEMSARYSELPEEFYVPDAEQVCLQSGSNKQGRGGRVEIGDAERFQADCGAGAMDDFRHYKADIGRGIAKELARINLPLSTYTRWVWQIDLHNLFHFLKLRLDPHAQYEIRVYAEALYAAAKKVAPICCEAFEDYQLNAVTLSRQEADAVRSALRCLSQEQARGVRLDGMTEREIEEFKKAFGL